MGDVLRVDFEGRSVPAYGGVGIADAPRVDRSTKLPAEFVSDVALYYQRGAEIREFIRYRIEGSHPPVFLLAQGLGAIPATELLVIQAVPAVKGLITIGSPVPRLYELDALPALRKGECLPIVVPSMAEHL